MNPRIGKRSKYNAREVKPKPKSVAYIELNTKKNITIKQEYLYLEDVKTAMNIHHLETSINLKKWFLRELGNDPKYENLKQFIDQSIDQDRHYLQKKYRITL
ncbi:MAG TPA: hypothetical protein P5514_09005 [Bacteroidales bacterium]|nr:hypothetical protein [Bacteroidales bacterium]HRX97069.1 hypothetical protein [Bacteroidales bacterium]